jgi:hypothetical protein
MGDLLIYYLQQAYLRLQRRPWDEAAEMAIINEPLPKPMVPDNFESTSSKCHQGDALTQIVQDSKVLFSCLSWLCSIVALTQTYAGLCMD